MRRFIQIQQCPAIEAAVKVQHCQSRQTLVWRVLCYCPSWLHFQDSSLYYGFASELTCYTQIPPQL